MTDVRLGNAEPFCNVLSVHCFLAPKTPDIFSKKGKTSRDGLFFFCLEAAQSSLPTPYFILTRKQQLSPPNIQRINKK